ncbi:MAG: hypothetical protein AAF533_21940 [Acidobacteriota bacterium]
MTKRQLIAWSLLPLVGAWVAVLGSIAFHYRHAYFPHAVSEAIVAEGWTARVLHREEHLHHWTEQPRRHVGRVWLHLEQPDGSAHEIKLHSYELRDYESPHDPQGFRQLRYELRWLEPGLSLQLHSGWNELSIVELPEDGHVVERHGSFNRGTYTYEDPLRPGTWCSYPLSSVTTVSLADSTELDAETRERLARLPLPPSRWDQLRMVRLDELGKARLRYIRCHDENVLIVFGLNHRSGGQVISRGPILSTGRSNPRALITDSWVFFDDHAIASSPSEMRAGEGSYATMLTTSCPFDADENGKPASVRGCPHVLVPASPRFELTQK